MFVPNSISVYFACKAVVTNLMFVPIPISAVFRMQIKGYKPYVRSQCEFCCISQFKQWVQTLSSRSVTTECTMLQRSAAPPRVFVLVVEANSWRKFQYDVYSRSQNRSHSITQSPDTMQYPWYVACNSVVTHPMSFPFRFLQYVACKTMVTNPMFVPNAISAVFRM